MQKGKLSLSQFSQLDHSFRLRILRGSLKTVTTRDIAGQTISTLPSRRDHHISLLIFLTPRTPHHPESIRRTCDYQILLPSVYALIQGISCSTFQFSGCATANLLQRRTALQRLSRCTHGLLSSGERPSGKLISTFHHIALSSCLQISVDMPRKDIIFLDYEDIDRNSARHNIIKKRLILCYLKYGGRKKKHYSDGECEVWVKKY